MSQLEGWEIAVAKRRVKKCRDEWEILKFENFEDLVQDCLVCWLEKKSKFDPDRRSEYDPERATSKKAFMGGVVERYLSHRRDALFRKKRKILFETESLDEFFDEDSESSSENRRHQPSTFEDPNPGIDISAVIQKLDPHQREICLLIQREGMSFHQIGKHLKKHHSYVYREVERIKEVFEQEGLKGYLKNF